MTLQHLESLEGRTLFFVTAPVSAAALPHDGGIGRIIAINPPKLNQPPVAKNDSAETVRGQPVTIDLLKNDCDRMAT